MRNDTILNRRKADSKIVDDRKQTVQMWQDYLNELYSFKPVPPFPPNNPIHSVDLNDKIHTAEDLNFTKEDILEGFKRAKTNKAVGLNQIPLTLIRQYAYADLDFFVEICN